MKNTTHHVCAFLLLSIASAAGAQTAPEDREELQMAALEALISAPEERALPLAGKVLAGDYSDKLKARALFVLSQIDAPEAQEAILATARTGAGDLRLEAVRMIGIGGNADSLAELRSLYANGDSALREAVLEAYLIADDAESVYELAANAQGEAEFEAAVHTLGAMGANEQLARLRDRAGTSESWLHALAISGDSATLREIALDGSNAERQVQAIEALGIVGGGDAEQTLLEIYRSAGSSADSDEVRDAVLHGMLVADFDDGVLELYRASQDPAEKKRLLQVLVNMDSDEIWDVIDSTLDGSE